MLLKSSSATLELLTQGHAQPQAADTLMFQEPMATALRLWTLELQLVVAVTLHLCEERSEVLHILHEPYKP